MDNVTAGMYLDDRELLVMPVTALYLELVYVEELLHHEYVACLRTVG